MSQRRRSIHLEIDEAVSAVESLGRILPHLATSRMGHVVTDRFCRRLIKEVGGAALATGWLAQAIEEAGAPILVHLPSDSSDGTVRLLAPGEWTDSRLQHWILDQWPTADEILDRTPSHRLQDEQVIGRPILAVRVQTEVQHPAPDDVLTRYWSTASPDLRQRTLMFCDTAGPLNGPRRRQLRRLIPRVASAGACLYYVVDLPVESAQRQHDLSTAWSLATQNEAGFAAGGPRMEVILPRRTAPDDTLASLFPKGIEPTPEELQQVEAGTVPLLRAVAIFDQESKIGVTRPRPAIWVDVSARPDVSDMVRLHRFENDGGELKSSWGANFSPDTQDVIFRGEFERPARTRFAIKFSLPRHLAILEEVTRQRWLMLITSPPPPNWSGVLDESQSFEMMNHSLMLEISTHNDLAALLNAWRRLYARFYRMPEENDLPAASFIADILEIMPEEGRQLWLDPRYRHVLLGDVVAAVSYAGRENRLEDAVSVVDRAIEIGMEHLGVPRGPIDGPVRVEPRAVGRNAAKHADCRLILSSSYLRMLPRYYSSLDAGFRTWLHESIHARQPYTSFWLDEFESWEGYEEGLADGMANTLCIWAGAIIPETTDYVAYVQAYATLAHVLQEPTWALLRRLWEYPTGRVREGLPFVVDSRYHELTGQRLAPNALARLQQTADMLFTTGRVDPTGTDREVEGLWQTALT